MKSVNNPKLSIVIPTLNRGTFVVDTARQVLADKFNNLELIVVDQSEPSENPIGKFMELAKDKRFRYFLVKPRSGVAAKNFGMEKAQAEIVIFLDDDIRLDKECLSKHFDSYTEHPDISATAGRVKQKGHEITKRLLYFDKYGIPHERFNCLTGQYTKTMPGGNMSIKRSAALAVGGFDTNFLRSQHREESEFSERFVRSGNKIYYEPRASLTHLAAPFGGTRIYKDFADDLDFYKNNLYFTVRYCQLRTLPIALVIQLRFYALRKAPFTTLRRVSFFAIGFITAVKRRILPIKTKSQLIKQLP